MDGFDLILSLSLFDARLAVLRSAGFTLEFKSRRCAYEPPHSTVHIYTEREKEERVWFDSSACAGSSLACRRRREYISLEELFFFLFKRAWEWNSNQKTEAWVAQKMEVDRFVKWRTPRWSLSSRWIDIHTVKMPWEYRWSRRSAVSHWGPQRSVFS